MDTGNSGADTVIPAQARDMLEKSLGNPHPTVRSKGIDAALRLGTRAVVPLLSPLLSDPEPRVRTAAIAAVARVAAAQDDHVIERFSLGASTADLVLFIDELRARRPDRALWLALLRSRSASVIRLAAIATLSADDDLNSIRALIEATATDDAAVRNAAEEVLRDHYEWIRSGAAEEALPALEEARSRGNLAVQQAASAWCERIRAAQLRRKMVESGVASVMAVTTALRSRSPVMRQAAAEACGKLRDSRATAALAQCLQDPDPHVRHSVASALCSFGWQAETAEQHGILLTALGRFSAACELGSAGVDALASLLRHMDATAQLAAVECLGATQSVRAMNALPMLLDSPNPMVSRSAAEALRKLEWVPASPSHALKLALALEDWRAAAAQGRAAIAPLIEQLKASRDDGQRFGAIENALYGVVDGAAAEPLLDLCHDGEVAGIAVNALTALVNRPECSIPLALLQRMADMQDVVQFKFALDPDYKRHVRAGIEAVSADLLRVTANSRLANSAAASDSRKEAAAVL